MINQELASQHLNSFLIEKNQQRLPIIILDIDDTVFRCVYRHYEAWQKLIEARTWGAETPVLIDQETFFNSGGSIVYKPLFKQESDFQAINARNATSELIHRALQPVLYFEEAIEKLNNLVKYFLTARSEKLKKLTIKELSRFPVEANENNVFCAPGDGAYEGAAEFKLAKLEEIALHHPGQRLVLIDDSVSTYQAIKQLNHPHIDAILFNGDMTSKKDYPEALDWQEIVDLFLKEIELIYSELLSAELL